MLFWAIIAAFSLPLIYMLISIAQERRARKRKLTQVQARLAEIDARDQEKAPTAAARQRLLDRIGDINDFSKPRPLVTLDEFFVGNDDGGSIGYNLPEPQGPGVFYVFLKTVASREDVGDVRVQVQDLEDPDGWPSTDTIWIVTSASQDEVRGWFPDHLAPDAMLNGFDDSPASLEDCEIPSGMHAIGAWYD